LATPRSTFKLSGRLISYMRIGDCLTVVNEPVVSMSKSLRCKVWCTTDSKLQVVAAPLDKYPYVPNLFKGICGTNNTSLNHRRTGMFSNRSVYVFNTNGSLIILEIIGRSSAVTVPRLDRRVLLSLLSILLMSSCLHYYQATTLRDKSQYVCAFA
jgi:hypothetical protein